MAILNGLASQFKNIITTLDVSGDNSSVFNLDFIKSRLLQEEQRHDMKSPDAPVATLFSSNDAIQIFVCTYC